VNVRVHATEPRSRANGPGARFVVWMQGCTLGCPGCFNPTTHDATGGREVTVEEIAAAADLSKATVYLYFRNKAEIYGGVLDEDMQLLVDSLERAYDRKKDIGENLLRFSRVYVGYFRSHPEYFGTLSFFFLPGREMPVPADIAANTERQLQAAMGVVERCIQDAIDRKQIRPRDTRGTTVALWSMWLGATYLALSDRAGGFNESLEHVVEVGVTAFLQGMTAAGAKR